jgi:hypothetical protein
LAGVVSFNAFYYGRESIILRAKFESCWQQRPVPSRREIDGVGQLAGIDPVGGGVKTAARKMQTYENSSSTAARGPNTRATASTTE